MKLKIHIIVAVFLCVATVNFAQTYKAKVFYNFNNIYKIKCDGENIWTLSPDGLSKWDLEGNVIKNIEFNYSGIEYLNICDFEIDHNGNIWTDDLAFYNQSYWTIYSSTNFYTGMQEIDDLFIDDKNNLWIINDIGIMFFNGIKWEIVKTFDNSSDYFVISVDNEGGIWLAGYFDINLHYLINDTIYEYGPNNHSWLDYINDIKLDESGNLWVLCYDGVLKFDGSKWTEIIDEAIDIELDNENNLIVFKENGLLIKYNGQSLDTLTEIKNYVVHDIACDSYGNIFLGSYYGLLKYDGNRLFNYKNEISFIENNQSVEATDGSQWFATRHGLCKVKDNKWHHYSIDGYDSIYGDYNAIAFDMDDNVWIGETGGGVAKLENNKIVSYKENSTNSDNRINSIFTDIENKIWIGSQNGVSIYDGSGWFTYTDTNGLINKNTNRIIEDAEHNIWVATHGGVSKFDGYTWTNYTEAHGLNDSVINCLAFRSDGTLFAGSNNGISYFDGVQWHTYYHEDLNLEGTCIVDMEFNEKQELIVGVYEDLLVFNSDTAIILDLNYLYGIYYIKDIHIDSKQNIWISSWIGCIVITPEEVKNQINIKPNNFVSPNPSAGLITIKLNNPQSENSIQIYDLQGRMVESLKVQNQNSVVINLTNQPKGVYFISIRNSLENTSQKLLLK